jgi:selenide,water dikinase
MALASDVSLEIRAADVPLFDGVLPLVSRHRSGGMATNQVHFSDRVTGTDGLARDLQDLLYDPQTSGGLLISVGEHGLEALRAALEAAGVSYWQIGRVTHVGGHSKISVV